MLPAIHLSPPAKTLEALSLPAKPTPLPALYSQVQTPRNDVGYSFIRRKSGPTAESCLKAQSVLIRKSTGSNPQPLFKDLESRPC